VQQEPPNLRGLPGQHLTAEVVDDVAVVARERLDEAAGVGPVAQRQRGQVQGGRPALGALLQPGHVGGAQPQPEYLVEQRRRLLQAEAQLLGADLQQLPADTHPGQRQRGIRAGGQRQV